MTQTNEGKLTAMIAGCYLGAEAKHNDYIGKVYGILGDYIHLYNHEKQDGLAPLTSDCQLLLIPLDKISDEDAIEVAKIWGIGTVNANHGREIATTYNTLPIEIYDYLRSRSYDLGYGSIPSLISAGIAIDKTKIG